MTTNFMLLIVVMWLLSGAALVLHFLNPRFGLSPLLFYTIGLATLLQATSQLGIYIQPFPQIIMHLSSNVLVPVILLCVLILYVAEGTAPARLIIFGIAAMSVLVMLTIEGLRLQLSLPSGGSLAGLTPDSPILATSPRGTIASLIAFIADLYVAAITFQGLKNHSRLPIWFIAGVALLFSLWTDAFLYRLLSAWGTPNFNALLGGDLIGKTLSALIVWPLTGTYLAYITAELPAFARLETRPTLDILVSPLKRMQVTLSRLEAELHESELRYRQLTDAIDLVLWLGAPEMQRVDYVNPAYEKIWGRTTDSLYDDPLTFLEAVHPDDRVRIEAAMSRQALGAYDEEYRIQRPDGSIRWIHERAFPIRDGQGHVYRIAGIAEDITRRKETESGQIELAIEREKMRLWRDFVQDASHNLKIPLDQISLNVQLLESAQDSQIRKRQVEELGTHTLRLGKLIDNLLTLSRLDNQPTPDLKPLDLNPLVSEADVALRPLAESRDILVTLSLDSERLRILADEAELSKALINLLDNAIRYTPEGGAVVVQTRRQADEAVIRVSDTGAGFAPADLPRLFDRPNLERGGVGLGLPIVKKVLERHHGRVEVSSEVGKGTTFTLYLPLAPSAE